MANSEYFAFLLQLVDRFATISGYKNIAPGRWLWALGGGELTEAGQGLGFMQAFR